MYNTDLINLRGRSIGDGNPTYIIAEIGINHNGSLEIAKQLIKQAAECGADAVKFQKRSIKELYQKKYYLQPTLGQRSLQYLLPILERIELRDEDYYQILEFCQEYKIEFLCTPFDKSSVDFLETLDVIAYKIGSPDLTNFELIEYLTKTKKPLIISTGMSTYDEIGKTVELLNKTHSQFILLHCNSNYPAPFHSINLRVMQELKKRFNTLVGYSGHEFGIAISTAAVAMGACIVERHFTLNRTMIGPDHAASLEPVGFKKMVRDIRNLELALGSSQRFMDRGEYMNREVLGKSLVAVTDIEKGERVKRDKISVKSPGTGISPQRLDELVGKRLYRKIRKDEQFIEEDIKGKKKNIKKIYLHEFHHAIGIITRPPDANKLIKFFQPSLTEIHLTDKDLQSKIKITNHYASTSLIIHSPEYWNHDLIDYTSDNERIRKLSLDTLEKVVQSGKLIANSFKNNNKLSIIFHPGGMIPFSADQSYFQSYQYKYKFLKDIYYNFTDSSVELLVENMPPFPWYFGGQWMHTIFLDDIEIAQFCRETKARICLDISHAALYCYFKHKDLKTYISNLLPYVAYVHIADAAGIDGEGIQIGEGTIDFTDLNKFFLEYKGSVTPEIWQGHKNDGAGFALAIEKLKKLIPSL